jgi:hypothetical protein
MLYSPNDQDTVYEERGITPPDFGAPLPFVVAREGKLLLAYYGDFEQNHRSDAPLVVNQGTVGSIVVVSFRRPLSYFSVPLSNETLDAHPLAFRGLTRNGVYRVEKSSWIRRLLAAQLVHRRALPETFQNSIHFVFVFHDSIFECVADSFEHWIAEGAMDTVQEQMLVLVRSR